MTSVLLLLGHSNMKIYIKLFQGLTNYNNTVSVINESVFHPSQLAEDRMLYFWVSGQDPTLCLHHEGPEEAAPCLSSTQ